MKPAFSRPTETYAEQQTLFSKFRSFGYEGLQLKSSQYQSAIANPDLLFDHWNGTTPAITSGLIAGNRLDQSGIDDLHKLIGFAQTVGSERIIFCIGRSRQGLCDNDIREFARILSELGKEAQQAGVSLSLHHHYDQPVMYRKDFDLFFEAVQDQSVKLTIDTAHMAKSGITDILGVFRDFREVLDNIHLKDFDNGEFKVLGQGNIDFTSIFSVLREIDYKSWLCVDEESGSDLSGTMESSIQFIKSHTLVKE
jgi:inosose dehydratase